MNLSLTLEFSTIQELQQFLTSRTNTGAAAIVEPAPDPVPLKVVEPAPAVHLADDPTPTPEPVDAVDATALKGALMARLKLLANSMDDPGQLGKFINSFGVSRFSELPDDQLVSFKAALDAEFGNE